MVKISVKDVPSTFTCLKYSLKKKICLWHHPRVWKILPASVVVVVHQQQQLHRGLPVASQNALFCFSQLQLSTHIIKTCLNVFERVVGKKISSQRKTNSNPIFVCARHIIIVKCHPFAILCFCANRNHV
jgi:hypothetical protein